MKIAGIKNLIRKPLKRKPINIFREPNPNIQYPKPQIPEIPEVYKSKAVTTPEGITIIETPSEIYYLSDKISWKESKIKLFNDTFYKNIQPEETTFY